MQKRKALARGSDNLACESDICIKMCRLREKPRRLLSREIVSILNRLCMGHKSPRRERGSSWYGGKGSSEDARVETIEMCCTASAIYIWPAGKTDFECP